MEEEKKVEEEKVEAAPAEEVKVEEAPKQEPAQQEGGMKPEAKNALVAFILSTVGLMFAFASYASIVGCILGIIALVFHKKIDREVEQQPFRVFGKIAKIVGIVDIIAGAVSFLVWLIVGIVLAVGAAAAAAQGAAA